jgi:hypothetical protein
MIPPAGIPFDAPDEAPEVDVGNPVPEVEVIRDVEEGVDVLPGVGVGVGTVVCCTGGGAVTTDVTTAVDVGIVVGAVITLVVSGGGVFGVVAGVVGVVTGGVVVGVVAGVVGVVTGGLVAAVDMATAV